VSQSPGNHSQVPEPGSLALVGLGKIGLPLAMQIAENGWKVYGCDINEEVVAIVNSGRPPFSGEPGMDKLHALVTQGNLVATTHTAEAISKSDVVIIVVPLIVDQLGNPEFKNIDSVTRIVGASLKPGTLVIYETTLPVGTTRNRFGPLLEKESGLRVGTDFFLAYSPERVYSGRVFENLSQYPKLVGGVDEKSSEKVVNFYSSVLNFNVRTDLPKPNGVWDLGSSEAAEFAKLAETTYRDVNIGLANEFALAAEKIGVDVYKVIDACNSQPFSHIHQPGISVGGHCIPVYPHFYLQGDPAATVVEAARKANLRMPVHAVDHLSEQLGDLTGKTVAILGLAYRPGVKEHAFSGAFALADLLTRRGATPKVHDPLYSQNELESHGLVPFKLGEICDAVVIQTNHREYESLTSIDFPNAKVVYDGRNSTTLQLRQQLKTHALGKGSEN
jgi:nucleotide sugar dehydrogenase